MVAIWFGLGIVVLLTTVTAAGKLIAFGKSTPDDDEGL